MSLNDFFSKLSSKFVKKRDSTSSTSKETSMLNARRDDTEGKNSLDIDLASVTGERKFDTSINSITIPSMFDNSPSIEESSVSEQSTAAIVFTEEKLNAIMQQYIDVHGDVLTDEMIAHVEILLTDIDKFVLYYGLDYHRKLIDPGHLRRYGEVMTKGEPEGTKYYSTADRFIKHFCYMLFVHKMLLEYYRTDIEKAQDLLKQLAVSHALLKVTSEDFKFMNIQFGKYLLRHNMIHDENMPPLITYFNNFTNHIVHLLDSQQLRTKSKHASLLRSAGRDSKPRENYRIMKRWRITVKNIKEKDTLFKQICVSNTPVEQKQVIDEDEVTLDTLVLKQRHWCMGKFTKQETCEDNGSLGVE